MPDDLHPIIKLWFVLCVAVGLPGVLLGRMLRRWAERVPSKEPYRWLTVALFGLAWSSFCFGRLVEPYLAVRNVVLVHTPSNVAILWLVVDVWLASIAAVPAIAALDQWLHETPEQAARREAHQDAWQARYPSSDGTANPFVVLHDWWRHRLGL